MIDIGIFSNGHGEDTIACKVLDRLQAGQAKPATEAASPVPNKIEPARTRQHSTPGADRGPER